MSRSVLLVVHQAHSNPGLVGKILHERGFHLDIRCPAEGDRLPETMEHHDAAVIFGGPMSANDDTTLPFIKAELNWIPVVLTAEKPFLGICLGAQLLARVLGATVAPHADGTVEIGYFPLQPTAHGNGVMNGLSYVYHWHREGFELPRSATLLATGDTFPHQAYQYGPRTYGLQFHPEINQPMMEFWTTNGAEQLTQQGAQPRDVHFQQHARYGSRVEAWLYRFLSDWL